MAEVVVNTSPLQYLHQAGQFLRRKAPPFRQEGRVEVVFLKLAKRPL